MKPGVRAIGIAESYTGERSTLAGAVVRADRTVDGLGYTTCTVGGTDATRAVKALLDRVLREDVRYLMLAGIAPAWYNVFDLRAIQESAGKPVLCVSFEASEGLESALEAEFSGPGLEERLRVYRRQPDRERVVVNDEALFLRSLGIDDSEARDVLRAFTPKGGRPEPLRVARLAARAGDRWRADS